MRIILDAKLAGETAPAVFDFLSRLSVGETISSASVTATVYSGSDSSPSSIISGSASIAASEVTQLITAGVEGVTYLLLCVANTSLSQVLELSAFLTITPNSQ